MPLTNPIRLPLYKKVAEQLREQCLICVGEMLPSVRQLSEKFEVNHSTISRALRELEEEGFVEVVPRKGVFSISRPVSEANIELVVFVSENANLLDVALRIEEGMKLQCKKLHASGKKVKVTRSLLSLPPLPEAERFVAELRSRGTMGIVCLGVGFFEDELATQEESFISQVAQKIPVVLAGSPHPTLNLDCVYGNPNEQLQNFLQNCYDQGLRNFEYLGERGDNLLQRQRRDDFDFFITRRGLNWEWNDLRKQDPSQLVAHLRSLAQLPEVVVATNVRRALTIALEAQRRGLCLPEELHILCFASLLEHAYPLLPYASVVLLDEPEVGAQAVQILQKKIEGNAISGPLVEQVSAHFISGPFQSVSIDQNLETVATAPVLVTF